MKQLIKEYNAQELREAQGWRVYILRCADGTYYTGVTTELARRVEEHNACDKKGARYTRVRRPVALVYHESADDRRSACRREWAIKRLSRRQKEQLMGVAL